MKRCRRTLFVMLVAITLISILPVSAFASYKVEPLKYNYWYSLKEDVSTVYKVKVTADTIVLEAVVANHCPRRTSRH